MFKRGEVIERLLLQKMNTRDPGGDVALGKMVRVSNNLCNKCAAMESLEIVDP